MLIAQCLNFAILNAAKALLLIVLVRPDLAKGTIEDFDKGLADRIGT